jgi:uncharacterized membrane protein
MTNKRIRLIVLILLSFLVILTGYLSLGSLIGSDSTFCLSGEGEDSPCATVQNTKYGYFLGIQVYIWGFIAFAILLALKIISTTNNRYSTPAEKLFIKLSFLGGAIALFFIYIQFFVLNKLCSVCLVIDSSMILILILSLFNMRR